MENYIFMTEMPTSGSFVMVWTYRGNSYSRSCDYSGGVLRVYYTGDSDGEVDECHGKFTPLTCSQLNTIYIVARTSND